MKVFFYSLIPWFYFSEGGVGCKSICSMDLILQRDIKGCLMKGVLYELALPNEHYRVLEDHWNRSITLMVNKTST